MSGVYERKPYMRTYGHRDRWDKFRRMYTRGYSIRHIGRVYDVAPSTVWRVVHAA